MSPIKQRPAMAAIHHFGELRIYQAAFSLQQAVFELTRKFPRDETYSLTGQVRRSPRSVGANVVEAWHKRRYEAQFLFKLTDADAELGETEHWLDTARACGYIGTQDCERLVTDVRMVGRMLGSMMADPGAWTRPYRRE